MAMIGRIRSGLPLLNRILRSDNLTSQGSILSHRALLCPTVSNSEFSRNYATGSVQKKPKLKVPLVLYGGTGNYASALYLASVKANALDKVESELLDLVEALKRSPKLNQFMKDLSVPEKTRVKVISELSAAAKFPAPLKNFLVVLAQNGRLRFLDSIAKRFEELTMAHRGEVKAIVTTVIPLDPADEKELKETLQTIIGKGKTVKLEQKIDPSILGGLIVEYSQKVLDVSIKTRAKQMERILKEPIDFGSL